MNCVVSLTAHQKYSSVDAQRVLDLLQEEYPGLWFRWLHLEQKNGTSKDVFDRIKRIVVSRTGLVKNRLDMSLLLHALRREFRIRNQIR